MEKELTLAQSVEKGLMKSFRERLWTPFMNAITRYDLIQSGDRMAACISGGKDSMLMAKLLQILQRFSKIPFTVEYHKQGESKNERRDCVFHVHCVVHVQGSDVVVSGG